MAKFANKEEYEKWKEQKTRPKEEPDTITQQTGQLGKGDEKKSLSKPQREKQPLYIAASIFIVIIIFASTYKFYDSNNKPWKVASSISKQQQTTVPTQSSQNWRYSESFDKMRGTKTFWADIKSLNNLNFNFPYQGGSTATLTLHKKPGDGEDVILKEYVSLYISPGQFNCSESGDRCFVYIKFDNDEVETYVAKAPSNGRTDFIFIYPKAQDEGIVSKLRKSTHLIIEAGFFQEGKRQMEFNVAGLDWK